MKRKLCQSIKALAFLFTQPKYAILSLFHTSQFGEFNKGHTKSTYDHSNSELNKYGVEFGADKCGLYSDEGTYLMMHDYLRHYDYILSKFRETKDAVIEFGCGGGGSIKMWKKYFPNAQIVGVDINKQAESMKEERIDIYVGDATHKKTRDDLAKRYKGVFLIVDDASHAWGDQRITFELFWPILTSGGFYIVEDLNSGSSGAYPEYPPQVLDSQPFVEYVRDRTKALWCAPDYDPRSDSTFSGQMPKHILDIEKTIDMAIMIPGAVALRKK
ncbi:MAG: SAM-dependent methyltransferase [Patescibacteria group bacterium]|jgi:hypothetical protein